MVADGTHRSDHPGPLLRQVNEPLGHTLVGYKGSKGGLLDLFHALFSPFTHKGYVNQIRLSQEQPLETPDRRELFGSRQQS